jgi:hypothetical protein
MKTRLAITNDQSILVDNVIKCGFQNLSTADKTLFASYYNIMNDHWASSISFASMIAWNKSIRIYHRVIGEYLCCLAQDTTCERWVILPLLGYYENDQLDEAVKELQIIMDQLTVPLIITDVSEWMLPYYLNLKCIKLKASYDLGLSDYIYTTEEFKQGLNRPHSRYNYNYFVRKNNPELVVMDHENSDLYLHFLTQAWCSDHECDYCQYGCLLDSAQSIIQAFEEVDAKGITVFVNNEMIGYTIVTQERDELIFHFKESIHKFRGLSEYMHRQCYQLFGEQVKIINYTEDLNLLGLRKYKQNLANFKLQHKYELSRE